MSKKKSRSRKKKRSSSFSTGFVAMFFLIIGAVLAVLAFKFFENGNDISTDSSEAMNQSKYVESSVADDESSTSSRKEETSFESSTTSGDSSEDVSEETSENASEDVPQGKYSSVAWYKAENEERYKAYGDKKPELSPEKVVTYVNLGLDGPYYTNVYPAKKEDGIFILVNKYSYVERGFEPANLVELDSSCKVSGKSVKLVKEAADAFKRLSADALELEYHIIGMSGYRTYAYQENLYNNYLKNDTKENVDTYSARPGYSEHHTGLALDVQTDSVSFNNFGQTKEYEWLLDNAHKYGFVIHYTEENQWITGYMPEEWHIRYLGVEAATYIYDNNLSVDEYLTMYGANGPQAAG